MKSRSKTEVTVETRRILRLKPADRNCSSRGESGGREPSAALVLIFIRSLDDRPQNGVAPDRLIEYFAELVNRRNENE